MKNLLIKEFKLALAPAAVILIFMPALLLIPNYPYFIVYFYTCMSCFFICLQGRENNDITYSLMLPIRKRDIVKARIWTIVLVELITIVFSVFMMPFSPDGNATGMDANLAFLGMSMVLLGVFNLVFLVLYYRDVRKVGVPFLLGCMAFLIVMAMFQACALAVPFFQTHLATKAAQSQYMGLQVCVLLGGAGIYVLLNWLAYRKSAVLLEKQDL